MFSKLDTLRIPAPSGDQTQERAGSSCMDQCGNSRFTAGAVMPDLCGDGGQRPIIYNRRVSLC